jgi:16S rRNA (guanine1207-N2)-methyltransferase
MTEHYYSNKPTVHSNEQMLETELLGMTLTYITDQGVFSKSAIDFGSRLLIETVDRSYQGLEEYLRPKTLLDLGCGYGTMGLAIAKKHPTLYVRLVDINDRAVGLCRKNADRLALKNVQIELSDGFDALKGQSFDWIVTNPPIRAGKQMIHGWFEQAKNYLNPGGSLWIVIQKKQGAPSAWKKLEEIYGRVEEVERDKGYSIYCSYRNQ